MKSYAYKYSRKSLEISLVRHQRRRCEWEGLQGEMRKLKPPSFDGGR